jgi:hypothetical protein
MRLVMQRRVRLAGLRRRQLGEEWFLLSGSGSGSLGFVLPMLEEAKESKRAQYACKILHLRQQTYTINHQ